MITRTLKITKLNTFKSLFKLATTNINDPYYILGVQKTADISEIKKAFYKLANEYHPDKVDGNVTILLKQNNADKFLLIKQAYESIKMQKGLIKPAGFIYDSDVKSMRPDPSRFDTDDQEHRRSGTDYRMHRERAQAAGQEYEQFKGTFKTLDDINDIKIRVEKGTMKDSSKRFNLADMKTRLIKFSSNSSYYYFFILAGAISFGIYYQKFSNQTQINTIEQSISKQDHKLSKRRIFDEEEVKQKKYMAQIEGDKDIKEFLEKNKSISRSYSVRKKQIQKGDGSV